MPGTDHVPGKVGAMKGGGEPGGANPDATSTREASHDRAA